MSEDNDDKTFRISPKAGIPYSDLNIPDDLLEVIQKGMIAHQTATEFIKVKDKKVINSM